MIKRIAIILGVVLLFTAQTVLLVNVSRHTCITSTEKGHLFAYQYTAFTGYSDIFPVAPPLLRYVLYAESSPTYLVGGSVMQRMQINMADVLYFDRVPEVGSVDAALVRNHPELRYEFCLAETTLDTSYYRSGVLRYIMVQLRSMLIPFILLGGFCGFLIAKRYYGNIPAFAFLLLWISTPLFIGWGATINSDVYAAATMLIGLWGFLYWCRNPRNDTAILFGALLSVMILTKLTWIVAPPLFILFWLILRINTYRGDLYYRRFFTRTFFGRPSYFEGYPIPMPLTFGHICKAITDALFAKQRYELDSEIRPATLSYTPSFGQLVLALAVCWFLVNLAYKFDGSFTPLKDYSFISSSLSGIPQTKPVTHGNRFAHSVCGSIPVPFPRDFITGIDVQRYDFERGMTSHINGQNFQHGWWWYYGYGILLKNSLAFTGLLLLAAVHFVIYRKRYTIIDLFIFLLFLIPFVFVSSQTGYTDHVRYIIPPLAALCLFLSRLFNLRNLRFAAASAVLLMCIIIHSAVNYPHYIPCFNELISERDKPKYMLGSNCDWGQAAYEMIDWVKQHDNLHPRYVSYTYSSPFSQMGIKDDGDLPKTPAHGYMILSVNELFGNDDYKWLRNREPLVILGGGALWIIYVP